MSNWTTIPPAGKRAFLALIVAQAAHSIEEYVFRLYDVFAPARFVSSLLTENLPLGFAIANTLIVLFGFWCAIARVRPNHPSARAFAWFWAGLEFANGVGHAAIALSRGGYFPGVATAPLLIAIAIYLALKLSTTERAAH
jgi:uncharacterized protein with HXXEE motif